MADTNPEEITEVEIHDPSPSRQVNPVQFFAPGGDPIASRDFRPSTFVFKNDENDDDEESETEDGHGNMTKAVSRKPVHPSENHRRIRSREARPGSELQQELDFQSGQTPPPTPPESPSSPPPAGPEEHKKAPGIAVSKQNQPDKE